jgi:phosphatidate cytidylyltransferase
MDMVNSPNATKPGAFATLGPRVVSSLIGFSIVVACVWFGWRTMLPMLMFVMVLGLREYRSMLRNRGLEVGGRISAYGYGIFLLISSVPGLPEPLPGVSWREAVMVAYGLHLLVSEVARPGERPLERIVYGIFGMFYVPFLLSFAMSLRYLPNPREGFWYLIITVVGAYASDVGAYAIGGAFGKRKLAPEISPAKTVEGAIGGLALSFVMVFSMSEIVKRSFPPGVNVYDALVFSLLVSSAAQLGDLAESVIKRSLGAKDSGSFLPGHGGMLDRMDSVLFVLPVAFYFLRLAVFS